MDWKALETHLFESARGALDALLYTDPGMIYGAAFHASYREEEHVIFLPLFAVNSQSALTEDHPRPRDEGFWSVKWNPADWRWNWEPAEYGNAALNALEVPLQAYANRAGPATWNAAERRFVAAVARAATALGRHFAGDPRVRDDFIAFFHDEQGGPNLARLSIPPRLFRQHFPEQEKMEEVRRDIASRSDERQVAYYLERLDSTGEAGVGIGTEEAERWLIAHGAVASTALLDRLDLDRNRWRIAMILGLIGVADPTVLSALRRHSESSDESTRRWCANALGYLGDFDWLLARIGSPCGGEYAVEGCCADLSSFRSLGATLVQLDYAPVERLLQRHPECAAQVENVLKPGSSFCEIVAADVPEALRGLTSAFVAVRSHAVSVLDNRRLSKKARSTIVAAVAARANDPDDTVRRLGDLTLRSLDGSRKRALEVP